MAQRRDGQIDFILTNALYRKTHSDTSCTQFSDHRPLSTQVLLTPIDVARKTRKKKTELAVKKTLTTDQHLEVLRHRDWPRRPYIQIAKSLGHTYFRESPESAMGYHHRLIG